MALIIKTAIGQDSHRFESDISQKPLILGGVVIDGCVGLVGNSDADVILHALTNAVSGITGVNILGKITDELCFNEKITDSRIYLRKALETLGEFVISHVSITLEGKTPKMASFIDDIKISIANMLHITHNDVGLTATTGEGLTAFGKGEGVQVFVIITAQKITN